MAYADLRDFITNVEQNGELKHLNGVDWNLEMGTLASIIYHEGKDPKPALLFDGIPGYPKDYRCLFGSLSSPRRVAMTLGLPEDKIERKTILQNWRAKSKNEEHCYQPHSHASSFLQPYKEI